LAVNQLPTYWYAVISALPDPELGERVNVALMLGTNRWAKIEFIDDLPKLSCLALERDLPLFRSALNALAGRVNSAEDYFGLGIRLGPHFEVSSPRELYHAPEGRTLRNLRNRYLKSPREAEQGRTRRSPQAAASHRLDAALRRILPMGAEIEKIASVERLYPELTQENVFHAPVPRLNRAIRAGDHDVLIGSVVVEHDNPIGAARDATARISQAFWQYSQAKTQIREITGREVRTLGVVLNGTSDHRPDVRSAKEYVLHLWRADADSLFAPERREDEAQLVNRVEELLIL
jgi:hypothetical protein